MALTAVILQAAIADPDLVRVHLADHHCWPALLAVCTCQPSASAEQHAQRLSQLSGSDCLSTVGPSISGLASTKQESHPGSATGTARSADIGTKPTCEEDIAQQLPCDQHKAGDAAVSPNHQSDQLLLAQHMQHTASAASHVAQLITCFAQSQPESGVSSSTYAGTDGLKAMLHCYAVYADTASRPLSAPVWPAQLQAQRQQHAVLEHVAQAGQCVDAAILQQSCHKPVPQVLHNITVLFCRKLLEGRQLRKSVTVGMRRMLERKSCLPVCLSVCLSVCFLSVCLHDLQTLCTASWCSSSRGAPSYERSAPHQSWMMVDMQLLP